MAKKLLEGIVLVNKEDIKKQYHNPSNPYNLEVTLDILESARLLPFTYSNPKFNNINIIASANYWSGSVMKRIPRQLSVTFNGIDNNIPIIAEKNLSYVFNEPDKEIISIRGKKGGIVIGRGSSAIGRFFDELGIQPTDEGNKKVGERKGSTRASLNIPLPKYIKQLFSLRNEIKEEDERKIVHSTLKDFAGIYFLAKYAQKHLYQKFLIFRSGTDVEIAKNNAAEVIDIINYVLPELKLQKERLYSHSVKSEKYNDCNIISLRLQKEQIPVLEDFLKVFKEDKSLT